MLMAQISVMCSNRNVLSY